MTPRDHADVREFVERALAARRALPPGHRARPSDYWEHFSRQIAYVRALEPAELARIRFHGYHLTADGYQKYLADEASIAHKLRGDYATLARDLDFTPDEGDVGYGVEVEGRYLSTDLLRYLQVVADLVDARVLPRDRPLRVLEIGGGYGGLAAMVHAYNPSIQYVLCDLEETLFFQATYLATRFGFETLELCEGEPRLDSAGRARFFLLPQIHSEALGSLRVDLAVNQQSMQEMTEEQVRYYCGLLRKCARVFYSCNLDAQGENVLRRMRLVRGLEALLDREFAAVLWEKRRARGFARLRERLTGRRRRTGDRKLRRVVYQVS